MYDTFTGLTLSPLLKARPYYILYDDKEDFVKKCCKKIIVHLALNY